MKPYCPLAIVLLAIIFSSAPTTIIKGANISINYTNFPDDTFRNWLQEQWYGRDNVLTDSEINEVTKIDVQGSYYKHNSIKNLRGIEYFTALKTLYCSYNQLSELDMTKNTALTELHCDGNQLTTLDVSKNTALKKLYCSINQLTTLDVAKNTALTLLSCGNNKLTALDVEKNTALTYLDCGGNELTTLDVTKNTALTSLYCNNNQLTALDVAKNTALRHLDFNCNKIKGANMNSLIKGLPQNTTTSNYMFDVIYGRPVESNVCTKSQVAAVKAKGWTPRFYSVTVRGWTGYEGSEDGPDDDNDVVDVNTPNEADGIAISVANFPDGNFRNWVLQQSYGIDGVLTDSELMEITKLSVGCKGIGILKGIELLTELTTLYCNNNQLTSLDLTRNTALTELYCWDNQLTALDVSKNTALTTLGCSNNQLTALDVSKNTALTELACYGNRIKGTNMDNLIGSLPQNTTGYSYKFYVINNNDGEEGNECTKNQAAAVKAKGWTPLCYDAAAEKWLEYEGSGDEGGESGEGLGTGLSQTDNTIYINNVEVSAGVETKLSVRMRNKAKIRGFQFDLYLPEGVTAVKGNKGKIQATLNRDRLSDDDEHTLTCNERPDGSIRFLCSSQYEETFTGNDGEVVMLLVAVNEDMAEGDYPIYLKNIKLSESNINQYYQAEQVESAMTVIGYLMGDVTGGGIVDVCDYIGVANEILGIPQEGFNMKAGDVNGDGVIDVSDYIGVANIIMTGSPYGTSTARGARKNKGVSEY